MFSATMPKPILTLVKKEFSNPEIIRTENQGMSPDDIDQRYYMVNEKFHEEALCRLIDMEPDMYGLIFCKCF